MSAGDTRNEAIAITGDKALLNGALTSNGTERWYAFDLTAGEAFRLAVTANGQPTRAVTVAIYAPGSDNAAATDPSGVFNLIGGAAGTYHVRIIDTNRTDGIAPGNFELSLDRSDTVGFGIRGAGSLAVGGTANVALGTDGDSDWYGIDLAAGKTYGFAAFAQSGASSDSIRIAVRDDKGNVFNDTVTRAGDLANFRPTTAGRYFIEVVDVRTDDSAAGNFTLRSYLLSSSEIGGTFATARPILNGQTITSRMDVAADEDHFALNAKAGVTYYATLKGVGTGVPAGELEIYAPDGTLIGQKVGATSGGGLVYQWTARVDGTYYLSAGLTPAQTVTGAYALSVTSTSATITGTAAGEVLTGRQQANIITGLGGNDTLDGGLGNDRLDAGSGHDSVLGGAGNDTLVGDVGNDTLDGGTGTDTLLFTGSTAITVDLAKTTAQVTGRGTDVLRNIEHVIGGTGADRLSGSALANTLTGGAGNDTLAGRSGNDILEGGAGNDLIDGGVGVDTAVFKASVAHVIDLNRTTAQVTGEGTDRLVSVENIIAGAGNDKLTGSAVANALTGAAGNDTLMGMAGNDLLNGGLGNDRIDGGTGTGDTLVLTGRASNVVNLSLTRGQITGEGTDTIIGIEWIDDLGGGNDRLTGNALANRIRAGLGNDTLDGAAGNDTLDGGAGTDRLTGGSGNDTLIGGDGNDWLSGGIGADTFRFDGNDGSDRIVDFQDGLDVVVLDLAQGSSLSMRQSGTSVVVTYGDETGSGTLLVENMTMARFTLGQDLLVV